MVIDILAHPELKNYDLSSLRKGKFKFSPHNILRGGGYLCWISIHTPSRGSQ